MSVNSNALSIQWGPLVDLVNDVKPFLQIASSDTSKDSILQDLIDGVSDWVQRECGRPLAKSRFTWKTGTNGSTSVIMLPYYPVLEIISCTEYWGISGPHVLIESVPTAQTDGFQVDYPTGALTRVFQGLVQKPWFPGSDNIWVTWDAGYNPVPASARLMTKEAIKWYWDNTQQKSRSRPQQGDQWQAPAPTTADFWGSVLPALMKPLIDQFASVSLG